MIDPHRLTCTVHRGLCAYWQADPERCDYCHRSWRLITERDIFSVRVAAVVGGKELITYESRCETRSEHTAAHDRAKREKKVSGKG